jgi:hypothetical protein
MRYFVQESDDGAYAASVAFIKHNTDAFGNVIKRPIVVCDCWREEDANLIAEALNKENEAP